MKEIKDKILEKAKQHMHPDNLKNLWQNRKDHKLWLIPASLVFLLIVLSLGIKIKVNANNRGKPQFLTAADHGRIEQVFVKPGDTVEPGKELVSFVITDRNGNGINNNMQEKAVEISTRILKGETFIDTIELPGIISPFMEINLTAKVSGEVTEVLFTEGQFVQKDDIIIRIEKKDYEIAVSQARSAFDLAKIQLTRTEALVKNSASTTAELDRIKADFESKKALLESAELALSRCDIKAPISGIMDRKFVEIGEYIDSKNPFAQIIDISKVKIIVGIPEQDISSVRDLKKIRFTIPSVENKTFEGDVTRIGYSTNQTVKVYPLEIQINNPDKALLPGMVIKAQVIRGIYENAIALPLFAVIPGDDEYYTFVEKNGLAEKRVLGLGSFQKKSVHIKSGLELNDNIIEKGLRLVEDKSPVKVISKR